MANNEHLILSLREAMLNNYMQTHKCSKDVAELAVKEMVAKVVKKAMENGD